MCSSKRVLIYHVLFGIDPYHAPQNRSLLVMPYKADAYMLLSTRWTLFLIPAKLALFIQRSRSLFIAPREADAHLLCSVRQMSIPCVLWTRCHLLCSVKHTLISYALLRGSLLWSWGDCIPLILWSHVARPFPPKKMDPISFYIHICFATLTFFYCKLLLRELIPFLGVPMPRRRCGDPHLFLRPSLPPREASWGPD